MPFPQLFEMGETNVPGAHVFMLPMTFGASVLSGYYGGGGVTIARNSAGNYTITLPMAYQQLMFVGGMFLLSSGTALEMVVASETVGTDGKLIIEARNGSTATDPANGSKFLLAVVVSRDVSVTKYAV